MQRVGSRRGQGGGKALVRRDDPRAACCNTEPAAPHIVDVEVFGVLRREHRRGRLDRTEANQAVEDLQAWPGERFGHRLLLPRAWQLRDTVRGWDAMYAALAEALDAVLVTTDLRLARAPGPTCRIEAIDCR